MIISSIIPNKYEGSTLVSLVPSISELLFDLGLENETIGITKFCVRPLHWHDRKAKLGGTKNVNIDKLRLLSPALILANKEENVKEQIELLAEEFDVFLTDVSCLKDAMEMIENIGKLTGKYAEAIEMSEKIEKGFFYLQENIKNTILKTAVYLIWQNPIMTIGGDTFISNMMQAAGYKNMFENMQRYPVIDINAIIELNPEYLLLSSEPYPFKQKHIDEFQTHLHNSKIIIVDGEMFSWYGSRLLEAVEYFNNQRGTNT